MANPLQFDIFGRDHGAGRTIDDLSRKVNNLADQVERLGRAEANPNIRIDIAEAQRRLEQLKAELTALRGTKVQIDADTKAARAELALLENQLEQLENEEHTVEVEAEIAAANARIEELRAKLATLKEQKLQFDADTTRINAQIVELEAKLATLRDVHINADLDATRAVAGLTALEAAQRRVNDSGNPLLRMFRDISGTLGSFAQVGAGAVTVLGAITSAAGSAVTSVSSTFSALTGGIGALQSFGQAGMNVGQVMTQLGQSLTQVGTSASSAGSAAAGAAGPFGAIGAAALQAVTAFVQLSIQVTVFVSLAAAIGGAVSLAIAGIAQLGGAVVALASGIVPLVQSLGLLPGLISPLVVGFGALAIGFSNVGKSGIEFKNTLDQLKNAFSPIADAIRSQMQPAVQAFIQSITSLAPIVQRVVPVITKAASDVLNAWSQMFRSSQFQTDFQNLLTSAANNFRTMGQAAQQAFQGITNMAAAAQPAVDRFVQFIAQGIQKWNEWTAAARQSGELTQIFNQAEQALESIINTIGNVAGLFKDLWDSASRTGAFQSVLEAINGIISDWRNNIQQVGGSWDQLMSRVASVAPQIRALIEDIGRAFTEIGANVDLGPAIEGIRAMIPGIKTAIEQMAQAASDALKTIGPDIGNMFAEWGPRIAQFIRDAAATFHEFAPAITEAGNIIIAWAQGVLAAIKGVGTAVDATATGIRAGWKALHGDITGSAAEWGAFAQRQKDLWGGISTGAQSAGQAVQQFGQTGTQAVSQVQQATQNYNQTVQAAQNAAQQFGAAANTSTEAWKAEGVALGDVVVAANNMLTAMANGGASVEQLAQKNQDAAAQVQALGEKMGMTQQQIDAFKNAILSVPELRNVNFATNAQQAVDEAHKLQEAAAQAAQPPPPLRFNADANAALAAARGVETTKTEAVAPPPSIQYTGDPSNATQAAGQVKSATDQLQDKNITITANADGLTTAVSEATTALAPLQDKLIKLTGDNAVLVEAAQQSVTALNTVVDRNVNIIANNQQALQAIEQVRQQLASLQDKTVTVTVRTVQTGGAGMIVQGMRTGGFVLPMASGGTLPRLTPMSSRQATIVPPNTWRVIGDRPSGSEAFIPINKSARSNSILSETANRMGKVVMPRAVVGMHSGGFTDGGSRWNWNEFWDWWRRHRGGGQTSQPAPQRLLQTVGQPYTAEFAGHGTVGLSGTALPITPAMLSTYYQTPIQTAPPSTGGGGGSHGGRGEPKQVYVNTTSALINELFRVIRSEIRKQGGDVQAVLGA